MTQEDSLEQILFQQLTVSLQDSSITGNDFGITAESSSPQKLSRRGFLGKSARIFGKALGLAAILGTGYVGGSLYYLLNDLPKRANKLPLNQENGLAILISYETNEFWEDILKPFGEVLIPAYVARIELAMRQKANQVITSATKENLVDVLNNPKIQSLAIFGHGSWNSWEATGGDIDTIDLEKYSFRTKRGYLLRHTCGESRTEPVKVFRFYVNDGFEIESNLKTISQFYDSSLKSQSIKYELIKNMYFEDVSFILNVPHTFRGYNSPGTFQLPLSARLICGLDEGKDGLLTLGKEFNTLNKNPIFKESTKELFKDLKEFFLPYLTETDWQFGTGVFARSRIFGWDRIAYPWDFMIKPFGDKTPGPPTYEPIPIMVSYNSHRNVF